MSDSSGAPARQYVLEAPNEEPLLEFARAVVESLDERPRRIPCRFLYDAAGSALFERICDLPEYYLTRAETSILERCSEQICSVTGPVTLIELGSGTSVKTDHLLAAYANSAERVRYVPVDVSESAIQTAARSIQSRHPRVDISGIVGTYENAFPLFQRHSPSMVVFLGSTIGNFGPLESELFWRHVAESLSPGDFFLLGIDLVKGRGELEAAYNDSQGVTAAFMKNLFVRMNRELGSGLDIDEIDHDANYNVDARQIEIFARFATQQKLRVEPLNLAIDIEAGESVLLEVSRKYVVEDHKEYLTQFGLDTVKVFTDEHQRFADLLMRKR